MNNKSYDRMSILFEKLAISLDEGSCDKAELMAYCAGLDIVRDAMEDCFNQIFIDTASGIGLSLFCEMFKIDSQLSSEEKKALIKAGMSQKFGHYTSGDFNKAIDEISTELSLLAENFKITINATLEDDYRLLSKLGRVFENYVPPCTVVGFDSDGMDFDYWDSSPYLFEDYDNFNLNFQLYDGLN